MKKILLFIDRLGRGGAQAFLKSLCNFIDKDSFNISILTLDDSVDHSDYETEFNRCGVNVFILKGIWIRNAFDFFKYKRAVGYFFKNNSFDVVHINSGPKNYLIAKYAKKYSKSRIIYHSHNTGYQTKNIISKIIGDYLKRKVRKYSDKYWACSSLAGRWMFGKNKFDIINNAIDLDKFKFDPVVRNNIRNDLGIKDNEVLIGNVGRFMPQKNHFFLIDVFSSYNCINPNSRLLLIGDGKLIDECKVYTKKKEIEDKVIFTGQILNTNQFYNAMDIFLMPSLFEGFPVVGVESQINGLTCVFSNTITPEIALLEKTKFCDIRSIDLWVKLLNSLDNGIDDRINGFKLLSGSKYDMSSEIKKIERGYLDVINYK